jgi:hypothetical protein
VVVAPTAARSLDELIRTYTLPPDTRQRVSRSVRPLERFPLLGARLEGRWSGYRFVLGPWRWMIVVYAYDEREGEVRIVAFEDGRSSRAMLRSRA